tara:strand:+ start:3715 stop:3870 length:156 start_codon:yes stop_codon:yes gene_type:complete
METYEWIILVIVIVWWSQATFWQIINVYRNRHKIKRAKNINKIKKRKNEKK